MGAVTHNVKVANNGRQAECVCDCGYTTGRKGRSQALAEIEAHLAVANKRK